MSGFELEISHQEIPYPAVDPAEAYAKLSSYTPGRPSFLLQSLHPESAEGRYSIVGYRVRRGETMPPGSDVIRAWFELSQIEGPSELAEAITRGFVGWISASAAYREHRLEQYGGDAIGANFMRGAAVLVYDHHERRAVVAGAVKGRAVDRLIWELNNAPDVPPVVALGAEEPSTVHSSVGAEKLQSRAIRAKTFLEDELEHLLLADVLYSPAQQADPLAVYRCWAAAKPGSHGFFLDFGHPPTAAHRFALFGYSSTDLFICRNGGEDGTATLHDLLPAGRMLGNPNKLAAKVARRLEDSSRGAWGGAVGYVGEGGRAAIALMDEVVLLDGDSYWFTSGAEVNAQSDPMHAPALIRSNLAAPLRALASVQAALASEAQ